MERLLWAVGPLEVAAGVDAQAAFSGATQGHVAPYAVVSWFASSWSAWAEVRLPELNGVPLLGDSDWLRIGFSTRITF